MVKKVKFLVRLFFKRHNFERKYSQDFNKKFLQSVIVFREQRFSVIQSVQLLEIAFVNYIKILLVDSLEHIKMGRFHPIW